MGKDSYAQLVEFKLFSHSTQQPLIPTCHYNQVQKNVTEIMLVELGLSTVPGDELAAHLHCEY